MPPIALNEQIQIYQTSFEGFGGRNHAVQLRAVKVNGQRKNFFPYLITQTATSFSIQEIHEWESNKGFNTEADIKGTVANKLAFSFFAADYAVNKGTYFSNARLKVRLSAFAFEAYWFKTENERLVAKKAPGIVLSPKGVGSLSLYDFTGHVLKVKAAPVSLKYTGCIVSVKLLDDDWNATLDIFINTENITSGIMKRDIMIKGTLWLQGEIAE